MPNGSGGPGSNPSAKRLLHSRGAASARRPGPQDYYNKSTIPIKWATGSGVYVGAFAAFICYWLRTSYCAAVPRCTVPLVHKQQPLLPASTRLERDLKGNWLMLKEDACRLSYA
eukprot:1145631-Pelagomonas_calceolata.AAC.5